MSKQENINSEDSDDNFGLPDLDFKPLDRAETQEKEPEEIAVPSTPSPVDLEITSPPETDNFELNLEPKEDDELAALPQPSYEAEEEINSETDNTEVNQDVEEVASITEEYTQEEEEEKANNPVVTGIIIAVFILGAFFLTYQFIYKPKADQAKKDKVANEKIAELKRKAKEDSLLLAKEDKQKAAKVEEVKKEEALNSAVGTITTLSEKTQRYYVVVASNLDDDLVMDFAKKLSGKGISTNIIPPFGGTKFYRLSIANDDTYAKAQALAEAAKAEYGNSLWVMKY